MKRAIFAVSILPEALNRGYFKTKILLLLAAFIGFSCTDHENPLALISIPAGKVKVDSGSDECLAISWPCDAEVDSVWTVFYGSDYRFQAHGDSVLFSHYLASNSKTQYWASETSTRLGRVRSGFRSGDGTCGIWSEAIDHDSSVVRIYKGDVDYLYRDTPNARYALSESDVQYPIAFVQAEGSVRHRDFLSVHNRNDPRPADLVERGANPTRAYYLPVNFSAAALDTLTDIPEDDRPYLDDSICSGDECPEWAEPICPSDEEEEVVVREVSIAENNSVSQASTTTTTTTTATATEPEPESEPESATATATEPEPVCNVTDEQVTSIEERYWYRHIRGTYQGTSVAFGDDTECFFPHDCADGQIGGCVTLTKVSGPGRATTVFKWYCFDCQ